MDFKFTITTLALAIAGSALSLPAMAQWQWTDKDGRTVFSDRAPPADVPPKNILRQPGAKATATAAPAGSDQPASAPAPGTEALAPAAPSSAPRPPGKDAQLEARIKQADALEKAHQQAEKDKQTKARADNCERVKQAQANLDSGMRIATINAKGEREVMDDAARAAEARRLQAIAQSDCRP